MLNKFLVSGDTFTLPYLKPLVGGGGGVLLIELRQNSEVTKEDAFSLSCWRQGGKVRVHRHVTINFKWEAVVVTKICIHETQILRGRYSTYLCDLYIILSNPKRASQFIGSFIKYCELFAH